MSEFRSKQQYNQRREFDVSGDVRSLICFCVDTSGSMTDKLSRWRSETKIDLLSKVLKRMIQGFRSDSNMRHAAAICIVTYNQFAQIKEDFQDASLFEDLESSCEFYEVRGRTNMTNGLNTSLNAIRGIQNDLLDKDQPSYTPLLVFMTDGEPVGDDYWEQKFSEIRNMVAKEQLHVFPVGIGGDADMHKISGLYPYEAIPVNFADTYCMRQEEDFTRVFDEIRDIVYAQNDNFPGEKRSAAADPSVLNTGSGTTLADQLNKFMQDTKPDHN